MEGIITSCPEVSGALIIGHGRFQSVLIVEAKKIPVSEEEREKLIKTIWPFVERGNDRCIAPGRVLKELITFTSPGKPFPQAGKGTIQRAAANNLYASEIDSPYNAFGKSEASSTATLDLQTIDLTTSSLQNWIKDALSLAEIQPDDDFFRLGMDSLQLINLVRAINVSRGESYHIDSEQVYENSTRHRLALSLHSAPAPLREDDDDMGTWVQMQQVYKDFTGVMNRPAGKNVSGSFKEKKWEFPRRSLKSGDSSSGSTDSLKTPSHSLQAYPAENDGRFFTSMILPDGGKTSWLQVPACFDQCQ